MVIKQFVNLEINRQLCSVQNKNHNQDLDKSVTSTINYAADALDQSSGLDVINSAEAHTLDEAFRERVRRSPQKNAYRQFDSIERKWNTFTWSQIAAQVERWQVAFRESGLNKGDRVAICYRNSIEWVLFDQAALRLGLVVVPVYSEDRADNIAYILKNSGAKLAMFSNAKSWVRVFSTDEDVSCVETILVFRDARKDKSIAVTIVKDWLPEEGQHFERGLAESDDLASIVYTSGTTGKPKGVMLSHRNMLSNAYSGMRSVALTPNDQLLSFLPLSHTFERTIGYYSAILSGCSVAFNRSIPKLAEDLAEIKPTVMISVPRIFERIHNQVVTSLTEMSAFKQFLFKSAINVGWHNFRYEQGMVGWHPKLLFAGLLKNLVAKTVLDKLGGRLRFVIVGGAAMNFEVAKVFVALGLPILQGYGLTESSPVVSVNTLNQNRLDSIGLPLRGVEVKLMDNNELWVKGDNIMQGYWGREQATQGIIDDTNDGRWLKTGDCASIDGNGFIRIVGRIKDILVLANGEKVPPTDIEAAIATNALFDQVMIVGEGKSFLSAIVVLNNEVVSAALKGKGRHDGQLPKVEFEEFLLEQISSQMNDFPGYAKVRKVHVCESEWTVEEGLLTSTLKIKRPKVMARYQAEIDAMYAGHEVKKV